MIIRISVVFVLKISLGSSTVIKLFKWGVKEVVGQNLRTSTQEMVFVQVIMKQEIRGQPTARISFSL